jgi:hypothetical protein
MAEPLRYAVLLTSRESLKPGLLAAALAPVLKQPAVDLAPRLRRCWGFVELDADEAAARAQVEALVARGLPALAVPRSLIEDVPAAEAVGALPEAPHPVRLVAAASFTRRQTRTVKEEQGPSTGERALGIGITLATGLPPSLFGVGGKKQVDKTVESSDLVTFLEVYAGAPARRLRVDSQDFDYSCLGPAMGYDTAGNFKKLVEQLSAGGARLTVGARALLAGQPARALGYEGLEDLEREARWLFTLAALGKDPA